jgi:CheY-like chemotaxis protein
MEVRHQISNPVLLFVEDDDDTTLIFCREFLKIAPYWKIICRREGLEAVRQLNAEPAPQGIVTDLNMPGMGGLALIKWIRGESRFRLVPLIVRSSSDDPTDRRRCIDLAVSRFLDKPAYLEKIRANIRGIVQLCEASESYPEGWQKIPKVTDSLQKAAA